MILNSKPTASLWAKTTAGNPIILNNAITRAATTPENIAAQVNKLLAIGGIAINADSSIKRIIVEEAIDNG